MYNDEIYIKESDTFALALSPLTLFRIKICRMVQRAWMWRALKVYEYRKDIF